MKTIDFSLQYELTDGVVILWSLTSPYHFSSPAIDSESVGRRTDKGMCMTLTADTEEPTSEPGSFMGNSAIQFISDHV